MPKSSVVDEWFLANQQVQSIRINQQSFQFPLADWAVFLLEGPDVLDYLQRRSSQDVKGLAVGEGLVASLLERKASIEAIFSVHRFSEDQFLVLVESVHADRFKEALLKFKIMERFEFKRLEGWETLLLLGSTRPESLGEALPQNGIQALNDELLWIEAPFLCLGRKEGAKGGLLVGSQLQVTSKSESLSLSLLDPKAFKLLKLEAGLPTAGLDYTHDQMLPETGLDHWSVSYTKGCYLGQETVAKIKTYGSAGQALMGLRLMEWPDQGLTQGPLKLVDNSKAIGKLTQWAYSDSQEAWIAFAYLQRDYRIPGKALELIDSEGVSFKANVALLPFYEGEASVLAKAKRMQDEAVRLFMEGQESKCSWSY